MWYIVKVAPWLFHAGTPYCNVCPTLYVYGDFSIGHDVARAARFRADDPQLDTLEQEPFYSVCPVQ